METIAGIAYLRPVFSIVAMETSRSGRSLTSKNHLNKVNNPSVSNSDIPYNWSLISRGSSCSWYAIMSLEVTTRFYHTRSVIIDK